MGSKQFRSRSEELAYRQARTSAFQSGQAPPALDSWREQQRQAAVATSSVPAHLPLGQRIEATAARTTAAVTELFNREQAERRAMGLQPESWDTWAAQVAQDFERDPDRLREQVEAIAPGALAEAERARGDFAGAIEDARAEYMPAPVRALDSLPATRANAAEVEREFQAAVLNGEAPARRLRSFAYDRGLDRLRAEGRPLHEHPMSAEELEQHLADLAERGPVQPLEPATELSLEDAEAALAVFGEAEAETREKAQAAGLAEMVHDMNAPRGSR